jgi:hypothetical protein
MIIHCKYIAQGDAGFIFSFISLFHKDRLKASCPYVSFRNNLWTNPRIFMGIYVNILPLQVTPSYDQHRQRRRKWNVKIWVGSCQHDNEL